MQLAPTTILTFLSLILTSCIIQVNAVGYKPDPTHRYEHKEDIEKLLHPNVNSQIHVVPQRRSRSVPSTKPEGDLDVDGDGHETIGSPRVARSGSGSGRGGTGRRREDKVLLMGGRHVVNHEIQNVVTNILEASAAVERESVLQFSDRANAKASTASSKKKD